MCLCLHFYILVQSVGVSCCRYSAKKIAEHLNMILFVKGVKRTFPTNVYRTQTSHTPEATEKMCSDIGNYQVNQATTDYEF